MLRYSSPSRAFYCTRKVRVGACFRSTYHSTTLLQNFNNCARHARSRIREVTNPSGQLLAAADVASHASLPYFHQITDKTCRHNTTTLRPRLQSSCTALHAVPPPQPRHRLRSPDSRASFAHATRSFRLTSESIGMDSAPVCLNTNGTHELTVQIDLAGWMDGCPDITILCPCVRQPASRGAAPTRPPSIVHRSSSCVRVIVRTSLLSCLP